MTACSKDDVKPDDEDQHLPASERLNKFVEKQMKDVYLWADQVRDRNVSLTLNPQEFLDALKYKDEDRWSVLIGEEQTTKSISDGRETSFGFKLQFYRYNNTQIFAMVLYVYPGSPAEQAGLRRGNLIFKYNGEALSMSNYIQFAGAREATVQVGTILDNTIHLSDRNYELAARQMDINPVLLDTIIVSGGKKIGYLFYTEFFDNQTTSLDALTETIGKFKQAQINDFILDLRYNPGGALTSAKRLCSLLAPANNVQREDLLITKQWNDKYQQAYQNTPRSVEEHLDPSVLAENLNLQRIYILVSDRSASASELVTSGLKPYMQVITIGNRTAGKYVGSIELTPKDDPELAQWTLYPIVFSYKNRDGESVKGGISPLYAAVESTDILYPLCDPADPLFGAALNLIGGQPVVTASQVRNVHNHFKAEKIPFPAAEEMLIQK